MKLHLGKNFNLDREALRQVWSLLAVRGAGKTYTAAVVVEEILERNLMPVVIIDPMDGFWGLKASADGKAPGYPVIVMGGTHADVPLEPTAGAIVADFFIAHRPNLVLVLASGEHRWPKAQMVRFVAEFGARLFERNAGRLMELVIDEADIFANQRPGKDELRCLGVIEDLTKRGRKPGIMLMLITQRSSNLNKNVLDETEMLVALRTTSPRDQDALDSWFRHLPRAQQARRDVLLQTWPKLPNGTAYFWCPPLDLFQKVEVRERRTFDSSATPEFGEKPREPKVLAPVDLEQLKASMAQTIERAKQEDPKVLRARIFELERALKSQQPIVRDIKREIKEIEKLVKVPALSNREWKKIETSMRAFDAAASQAAGASELVRQMAAMVLTRLGFWKDGTDAAARMHRRETLPHSPAGVGTRNPPAAGSRSVPKDRIEKSPTRNNGYPEVRLGNEQVRLAPKEDAAIDGQMKLGLAERRILSALVQHPEGRTARQLAVLTGYAVGGGGFGNALGNLRQRRLIEGRNKDLLRVTSQGEEIGRQETDPLPPPGPALFEYWMRHERLGHAEREILRVLNEVYPQSLATEDVAQRAVSARGHSYAEGGGGFGNAVGKLRTLKLIEGYGQIRLVSTLVE